MQRRLQRSVSETRRSVATRPCRSTSPPLPGATPPSAGRTQGSGSSVLVIRPNVVPVQREMGRAIEHREARLGPPPERPAENLRTRLWPESAREPVSPRTVFSPYARLFAVPGSAAFSVAGWVGRLPAPMLGLGAVFLVEGATGSYGLAGAVSGTLALAYGVAGPQWARAMDRRGQAAALRWAMGAFLVTGIAFVTAVVAGGPAWSWFVLAAAVGSTGPNIGSLVRARWSAVLDPAARQTAFAFEAVVDEVVFVVGPPLVTVLATLLAPPVGFLTGVVLGVGGGLWLASQRATEPPVHRVDAAAPARRWSSVLTPTLLVVVVTYLAVGALFGAIDVVVVGFAEAEGAPALSGAALAVFAGGSLVAGLVYGLVRLPGTLAARFVGTAVAFGAGGAAAVDRASRCPCSSAAASSPG